MLGIPFNIDATVANKSHGSLGSQHKSRENIKQLHGKCNRGHEEIAYLKAYNTVVLGSQGEYVV